MTIDGYQQDDQPAPGDLVAEPDTDPVDLADDEYDDSELETYPGTAHDGPFDGQRIDSRYPKGFLLLDMEHDQQWYYDRHDDGDFYARSTEPSPIDDTARWDAAEGEEYDILVPDVEFGEVDA